MADHRRQTRRRATTKKGFTKGEQAMTDQEVYLLYSEQFRAIDDDLDFLVAKAENFLQANRIILSWQQANLNYLRARNLIFSSHLAQIEGLITDFRKAQESIKAALADLKHDAAQIGFVSTVIATTVKAGKELLDNVEALEQANA